MFKLSVGEIINAAWEYALDNWLKLTLLNLLLIILMTLVSWSLLPSGFIDTYISAVQGNQRALTELMQMTNQGMVWQNIISWIIESVVSTLLICIVLGTIRGNGKAQIIDSIKAVPASAIAKCAGFTLAITAITSISINLLSGINGWVILAICIAALYLYLRIGMTSYVLIEEPDDTIGDAIKASWDMTSGNAGSILLLLLAAALIMLIGMLACCVGMLFTSVIVMFMIASTYVALADKKNPTIFDKEA